MQAIRIINSFYETDANGVAVEKWKGGETYALSPEAKRQVDRGNGEIVDVEGDEPAVDEPAAEVKRGPGRPRKTES